MAGTLHIHLLDNFRLLHDDVPLTGFDSLRLQSFLAYLLLHRTTPQSRSHISFLFWPDSTESQARTNLRKQLYHLRQALPDADYFLHADASTIHWQAKDRFTLDVGELECALDEAEQAKREGDAAVQRAALDRAVSLYAGDLLLDCYDDWVLSERERLRVRIVPAIEALAQLLEEERAYEQATRHVQHLLRLDPLHEPAYRRLMRLFSLQGNHASAIRAYQTCAITLEEELGVAPSAATEQLYHDLLELDAPDFRPAAGAKVREESLSPWPLVGREAVWAQLQAAWAKRPSPPRRLALLGGEAGIGKTRLAEEFAASARRQGIPVAMARCYPGGQSLAYTPVTDWLRSAALERSLHSLDPLWLTEISRVLPEILVERPDLTRPQPMTEPWQRQHLFEAMALPFEQQPLLLLIDDIHWADRETIEWLSYLMHRPSRDEHAPSLLVVATARAEDLPHRQRLQALVDDLRHSYQLSEIELSPLTRDESLTLARAVAGGHISPALAAVLYEETEGNPLFVVETVRAALAGAWDGARNAPLPGESTPRSDTRARLPAAVHSAILSRLAHLSPEAQELAGVAAILGRQFSFDVLLHAAAGTGDLTCEDVLVRALDELWRRHIVRQSGATAYDFSHDKIRQVVYDDLSPVRRRHLHRRVAAALSQADTHDVDTLSGQIATHFELGGMEREAIDYYRRAAAVARRIYANEEAVDIYRHLLDSDLSTTIDDDDMCAIMCDLGGVWQLTGDWAAAEAIYRQALAIAEDAATAGNAGSREMVARCHFSLGNLVRQQGAYDEALQWLSLACEGFEAVGDRHGLVRALWAIGEVHWYKGDHGGALQALERQMELAGELDDYRAMSDAAGTMGIVYWSLGEIERSRHFCRRSIEIAEGIDHWWGVGRALITIGNTYHSEGDISAAFTAYEQAFEVASQIGDKQCKSWAVANIGELYRAAGQHRAALAHYRHTLQVALEIGETWSVSIALQSMAAASDELRDTARAEDLFHKAIALGRALDANYLGTYLLSLALFYDRHDRLDQARHYNDEVLSLAGEPEREHMAGEDIGFRSRLLDVRLRHRIGEIDVTAAGDELECLLSQSEDDAQRALIHYEMWQLDPSDGARRDRAARLYRTLPSNLLRDEIRRCYADVTGEIPPPLPAPPDPVQPLFEADGDADAWLAQVEALIADLQARS
ncbi:MAG: tetratricopeptide repeat protein [Anaerolineae bacterium]|nr:tetratricopeptide repeat protein [Anaerolineae bacterium]